MLQAYRGVCKSLHEEGCYPFLELIEQPSFKMCKEFLKQDEAFEGVNLDDYETEIMENYNLIADEHRNKILEWHNILAGYKESIERDIRENFINIHTVQNDNSAIVRTSDEKVAILYNWFNWKIPVSLFNYHRLKGKKSVDCILNFTYIPYENSAELFWIFLNRDFNFFYDYWKWFLAEEINKVLPNSVEITEEGKVAWQGTSEAVEDNIKAIKDNIKELEKKALIEAYQKDYAEALKNQAKYEAELTTAMNAHESAEKKVHEAEKLYQDELDRAGPKVFEYKASLDQANEKLEAQKKVLYEAESQYAQNEKAISLYTNAVDSLDGNIESSAKLQAEMYTEMGQRGTSSWSSLGNALMDLDAKQAEHLAKGLDAQNQEVQVTAQTAEMIREECVKKAAVFGDSYDKMIENLEDKGVVLSENEKELLEQQYNNYQESTLNKSELQKNGFDNMIAQLEESGLSFTEIEKSQLAAQFTNWSEASKAKEGIQALSYDSMLTYLEESGIVLNEREKSHLEQQYALWVENAQKTEQVEE